MDRIFFNWQFQSLVENRVQETSNHLEMWLEWQVCVLRQVHPERIEDARLLLGLLLPEEDVQSVLHFLKTEMNNEMAKQIRNLEIEAIAMSPSFCSCKQQQVVIF